MVITTRIYAWLMILGVIRHRYILGGYHHQPAVGAFQWFLALQKVRGLDFLHRPLCLFIPRMVLEVFHLFQRAYI